MASFHVYIDKRDIKEDGSIYVEIDDWDISDACADNGGCCNNVHEDNALNVDEFTANLDDYYFKNALKKDKIYDDIVRLAGGFNAY